MTTDVTLPEFARDLLRDLRNRFGMDQWMLTRVVESDAMVIFADGDIGLPEGAIIPWGNSLEARLAEGGPLAAPDLASSPYVGADPPVPGVRSFAGIPVRTADGGLFGALYGVGLDAGTFTETDVALPLSLAARALHPLVGVEQIRVPLPTSVAPVRSDPRHDPLTGLLNGRGWEEALQTEDARCRRYGNHASIVAIGVDGLQGEEGVVEGTADPSVVLRQTGDALRSWRRGADVVAHLGEGIFCILLVEVWQADAASAIKRLAETLTSRRIGVRMGVSDNQDRSLVEAAEVARALAGEAP